MTTLQKLATTGPHDVITHDAMTTQKPTHGLRFDASGGLIPQTYASPALGGGGASERSKENSPIIHRMNTKMAATEMDGTTTPTNMEPEAEMDMGPSSQLLRERTQLYNAKVMWLLRKRNDLPKEHMWQLNALYDNTTNINEFKTNYALRGHGGEVGCGRVYASQKGSLETLPRIYRANLCADYYWDVDIVNAQPNLLLQLARRRKLALPQLKYYCHNREKVFALLTPVMGSREAVKSAFIQTLFGGSVPELEALQNEVAALATILSKEAEWAPLYASVVKSEASKSHTNVIGAFLAFVAQTLERQCLEAMDQLFTERGRSVDVLAYDGLMIRKAEDEAVLDTALLREAETYVSEQLDWTITLAIKPMVLTIPAAELDAIKVMTPAEERWAWVREGTPTALCAFYASLKAGETLYSPSLKSYFIYDRSSGIWKNNCAQDINNDFVRTMAATLTEMKAAMPSLYGMDPTDARKGKTEADQKAITAALNTVCKGGPSLVSSFLPSHCMGDFEPVSVFNSAADLYPLQNGVYSFSQRKLLTYKKEYHFTFKVPINYNPDAPTADIEKAMGQWFMGNAKVVAFMKYYIGYCLTPETKRQDFLTLWGETAGNGKSTLFGDLLPLLMGHKNEVARSFSHTLNVKDLLVSNSANSDSTYNLAGKRYAVMSEPKLDDKQKLDGEMLKRLTGDTSYSVCAKYKGEITFTPLAKIIVLCNRMFKIDVDDEGQLRRLLVAEMGSKFVSATDYAALSPTDKASGRFHIRDDTIIERLTSNLEGVMRYFLEGASEYVSDRFRAPPPELYAAKLKAVKDLDELARWIKGYLVPDAEAPALTLRQLKSHWKTSGVPFSSQIREKGFNKTFFQKCERLGLKVKWNEDRSDEGKVLGMRLYDEDVDGEEAAE
jgi:phage/plasmid-associated DNA primase